MLSNPYLRDIYKHDEKFRNFNNALRKEVKRRFIEYNTRRLALNKVEDKKKLSRGSTRLQYLSDYHRMVCHYRKLRKEVLFALDLTGKGSKARRRKFNEDSKYKC